MEKRSTPFALSVCAATLISSAAVADFGGQTILGPLVNGSAVTGDTSNSTDDNDGFTSGMHIFDIWDGGDDVWQLNWDGGSMRVDLIYDNSLFTDVDLFVYRPGGYDDSGDYSIANTGLDTVVINGAAAGAYFIVIDSTAGAEGPYDLRITPTPGTATLFGLAFCAMGRRRR